MQVPGGQIAKNRKHLCTALTWARLRLWIFRYLHWIWNYRTASRKWIVNSCKEILRFLYYFITLLTFSPKMSIRLSLHTTWIIGKQHIFKRVSLQNIMERARGRYICTRDCGDLGCIGTVCLIFANSVWSHRIKTSSLSVNSFEYCLDFVTSLELNLLQH